MRYKKSVPLMVAVIMAVLILVRALGGGDSAVRIGYVGNATSSHWSGRYLSLDGTMQRRLKVTDGSLEIAVETEEGTLGLEIRDAAGNVLLSEADMGTQTVSLPAQGRVSVKITGANHRGSFSIES